MKTKRPLPKRFSGTMRVSGILVGLIAVLLSAASIAMAAPFAYVSSFGQDSVTVVDGATGSVVKPLTRQDGIGAMPYGVAVNRVGTRAYVANFGDGTVSIIDMTTNTVIGTPTVCESPACMPTGVAVNDAGTRVYVANGDGTITVIDATSNSVLMPPLAHTGGALAGIVVVGSKLFVADFGRGSVLAVDVNNGTFTSLRPNGNVFAPVFGIAANPSGSLVYVPYGKLNSNQEFDLNVAIIDPNGPTMIVSVPVGERDSNGESPWNSGNSPAGIAVSASRVYVAVSAENAADVIDTTTNMKVASVPVGASPFGVAVDQSGAKVFVGNSGSGRMSMIDTATNTVTGPSVAVGPSPLVFGAFVGTPSFTLTTGASPSGAGAVTPATGKFDHGTQVTVTAVANAGYQFTGWSGACPGTSSCTETLTPDQSVTANFKLVQYTLTTGTSPSGAGTIAPASGGKYDHGTQVTVTAVANAGYQFTGWSGACPGTGPCIVSMTSDQSVTANFVVLQYTLTTGTNPSGAGTVTPASGNKYNYGTQVTVATTTNTGYQFTGWSGACNTTGPCTVMMTGDRSVTANYALVQYTLTTGTSPSGAGTVTPATGSKYNYGTQVSVTATANTGYEFTGWSGACTSTGPCSVPMTFDKSVTANFAVVQQQFSLTLATNGTGTGTVGALPSSSTGKYNAGTDVSVSATPGTGCKFNGWAGACSGNADCKVRMDAAKTVTANFTQTSVPTCDEKIGDLQKQVAADKHHWKYGHSIREALRLYAAAQQELARAKAKVGDRDKKYVSALKEFDNGKAAFCAGRYWRAAHEFWEAYQIAHKILEQHRR